MFLKRLVLSALVVFAALYIAGCGGGSAPMSVTVTASSSTVDATDTTTVSATVLHDKNGAGVSWKASAGTISGTTGSATYTAPAASKSSLTVTITATSVADATKSGSVTITVPATPSISTSSMTAGAVGTGYNVTLAASGGISPYTWTITTGTLPAGLTMSTAGVITGSPIAAAAGTSNLTFKATDSGKPTPLTATASLSITVAAAPAITFGSATPANGTFNAAYTGAIAATGGAGTLTYTIASGAFPNGISMSSSGALTGTPTKVGTFSVTVQASDAFGDSATQAYSMKVVYPALSVTAITPPTGYVGSGYTQTTLAATGGSGTGYTWAVSNGSALPAGLSLSAAGVITGKPTAAGSVTTSVTVTDSASNTGTGSLSFTIKPGVSITTGATLPTGYVGSSYSQTLAATGGSGTGYTWAVASGSTLPAGLGLSSAGVLSGKPTAAGNPSFTITVTDSASNTASATFTMTIAAGITISTPAALPTTFVGASYSQTLAASGGSGSGYTWAVTSGSTLPAGLSLSTAGVLSGKATTAAVSSFSITVTDSASNTASATFSLTVSAAIGITTPATLPDAYVGANYSQTLAAGGGSGTGYVWAVTSGASNLAALNLTLSSGGVLSGIPASIGSASFSVTVTDSASNTASATFSITAKVGVSITTGTTLPAAYVGTAYSQTLAATGGSGSGYTWAVASGSTLPGGLSLSSAGLLSGPPTTPATSSFTITVSDSASNTASATFSLTVNSALAINAITLPKGYQGAAYPGATFTATGGSNAGYSWSWTAASGSSLPAGLGLSAGGAISGTPTAAGTFSVVVKVTDSASNTASQTFSLTVEAMLAITSPATLKSGTINVPYSTTLAAIGGSGTYTGWTVTVGAAQLGPLSLTLSSGGVLSGTPTVAGNATFTVQVSDSESHTATASLTVSIFSALTITTTSLPAAGAGTSYSQTLSAGGGTSTGYTWTASASNLSTYGLSLSTAGVVSGTPTTSGTASFTPTVTDSGNNTATASAPLTILIYAAVTLPTTNPASLPNTGTTGVPYSGSISATGGSGNYAWTVTVLPTDGLSFNTSGGMLNVTGTPTAAATITFKASVKDTTTNVSVGPDTYTITVTNPVPLTLPAPNPITLPSATVNQSYTGSINATGGVGPYTWTVNGLGISQPGLSVTLTNGLSATTTDNNILTINGATPTPTGTVTFTAAVMDSLGATAGPTTYTVVVNPAGSQVSGQFFLNNYCYNGNSNLPVTFTVGLYNGSTLVQSTTTDVNGNYSFTSIPNGTYSIKPSLPGAASLFYPASYTGLALSSSGTNNVGRKLQRECGLHGLRHGELQRIAVRADLPDGEQQQLRQQRNRHQHYRSHAESGRRLYHPRRTAGQQHDLGMDGSVKPGPAKHE